MSMELQAEEKVVERSTQVDRSVSIFCERLAMRLCQLAGDCEAHAAEFLEPETAPNLELYFVSVKARELMNEVVVFQRGLERDPDVAAREKKQATQDFLVWLAGVAQSKENTAKM